MSDTKRQYAVFLSHNSRDKDLIESLAYKLRESGLSPWFDKWELVPGNRWVGGLADGLHQSDTCAVFIGPHNLGNWEAEEIDLAHDRAAKNSAFRLIPVLLPGVPDPFDANSFPPFLKTRTWVDFRKGFEDQRAFHSLLCGIKGIAPGPELDPLSLEASQKQMQDVCPYRGLQVFNEEDAQFYLGRAGDIQRLVEKLKVTRFLGVLGASGSGKSSLVRAGLVPALRAGELFGSEGWRIVPVFPLGSAPLEALILNFARLSGSDSDGLLGLLRESERALHTAVRNFLELPAQKNAGTERVLLVVDQLEEVFTLCDRETDRAQFLANLLYAGSVPEGGCVVVLTMRADFYHKCAAYPEFAAALAAQQFLVSPMHNDSLAQAIQEPARSVGLEFEQGLVETIVADVASQPGSLPLLEHALLELWKRRKNGRLTLEAYIDTGTVQGAIAKRADAIYDSFSREEQLVMQRIMLRLTQPGEGTEDTRRRASIDELITRSEDREMVERVIDVLTRPEHRLLTTDEKAGVQVVEVSHEALIRGWERLRKWLDEDREGLRLHRRLSEAAKEWKDETRADTNDDGLLYRGLALARATEWRKRHEVDLNELEREFLNESEAFRRRVEEEKRAREQQELEIAQRLAASAQARAAIERKARVRQRYFTIGLAVLVVVTSALLLYAYRQYKVSRSREIASKAAVVMPTDPILSVLLAVEAARTSPTTQAEAILREALISSYGLRNILQGHTDNVTAAVFSPDGNWLVTASQDNTARAWEVDTARTVELKGHPRRVVGAVFSPDGKWVVTASWDNTARVWEAATGRTMQELKGHTQPVNSAVFSSDGKWVVTASWDNTARVWEAATGRTIQELKGHTQLVNSAVFSPDGKWVVTASQDNTARVWEVASGRVLQELKGHTGPVHNAVFSPDGKWVMTAGSENIARVWEAATGRMVQELKGHTDSVSSAAFSPDSQLVVTSSLDKTARVWEAATGRTVQELKGHADSINSAVFSSNGEWVLTGSSDKTARVWEVASGRVLQELTGHTRSVNSAVFSPDGKWVATASADTTARVREAVTGRTVQQLTASVNSAVFGFDGKQIVTAGADNRVRIWQAETGQMVHELIGHTGSIKSAVFSPDDEWLVTASTDGTARVWEVASGRMAQELIGHTGSINSAVFSSDGKWVVTASTDSTARVWEAATGRSIELVGHTDSVHGAVFSPDGKWVVTASEDKTARVWEAATGRTVQKLIGHTQAVYSAVFSPDGKWVVTAGGDKTARVWEAATGRTLRELKGHTHLVISAVFSPDGRWVVTASWDDTARLWEAATGRAVEELKGHADRVNSAVFSADGKWVVTSSADKDARVWEVATGRTLQDLKGHTDSVNSAAFSPDGKHVVTASDDGVARVFDCEELGDLESLLDLAKRRVHRTLTDEERRLYLN